MVSRKFWRRLRLVYKTDRTIHRASKLCLLVRSRVCSLTSMSVISGRMDENNGEEFIAIDITRTSSTQSSEQ